MFTGSTFITWKSPVVILAEVVVAGVSPAGSDVNGVDVIPLVEAQYCMIYLLRLLTKGKDLV